MVAAYGLTSACDTLFPQLYGGNNLKKIGIVLQKGNSIKNSKPKIAINRSV